MPIRPFLDGQSFDPETTRVMGVAFETARIALRLTGDNLAEARIAERIVELAKAGERNSDLLCERVLYEFGKPGPLFSRHRPSEYHLIDLTTGLSHGGFISLAGARQYAHEEAMAAWQIFHGSVCVEQHDPREADPVC